MRKKRLSQWGVAVIACALLFAAGKYVDYLATKPPEPEKQVITVNAPADMESAFKDALVVAEMDDTHKIVMTDQVDANICIGYGMQNDESYQKMAYTPFIVAYNTSSEHQKKLRKSGVFVESPYDDNFLEVDVLKIIDEAIGEGKWANFGLKDENEFKVFYPDENSVYWNDFYDFLLVTVNDGQYPKNEEEMENAKEIIRQFLDSEYTEGVTDFYEQVARTSGFPSSAFYILTEKDALVICSKQRETADIYYPIKTVYFNYYVKGDDVGKQIVEILGKSKTEFLASYDFYRELSYERYRSANYSMLSSTESYTSYERDVYNVAKIPVNVEGGAEAEETAAPTTEVEETIVENTAPVEESTPEEVANHMSE